MRYALLIALAVPATMAAQTAPSFARDVAPIFAARCAGCHAASVKMGNLDLDSYESVKRGGLHGTVIVPGRSQESRLYLMITAKLAPAMPMDGKTLAAGEIALIGKWIDAGAPAPSAEEAARLAQATAVVSQPPAVASRVAAKAQTFALAYRPDGKSVALGGFREVRLADATNGRAIGVLSGHADAVRAVAFSRDGRWLAAGGGLPGRGGEVKIWDVEQRAVTRTLSGHADCIYAIAFSPDGKWLATSSYDKLIKLWDVESGKEARTLRDHIDAVYALAFTPDGRRLVSGAADRTVKIWDVATGERLYTFGEPLDAIQTVALDPAGKRVAAAGADKSIRIWSLGEKGGALLISVIAHEDAILKLAWSPDGKALISAGADRAIKIFQSDDLTEVKSLPGQPDWVYGLEFAPDGKTFAAGRFDGSLSIYDSTRYQDTIEARRATR